MKCQFLIAFKSCGKPATHTRHVVVESEVKGQHHKFSPPDEYYCDRHANRAKHWGGEMTNLVNECHTR